MVNKYNVKNNVSVEVKNFGIDSRVEVKPNREATFIISAEKRDDDGEVVRIDGMDITAVESGARDVAWANHDYDQPAAKIKSIRKIGKTLIAEVEYPERPIELPMTETWHPDVVYAYAKVGLMKASIDFLSTERREASKKDIAEYGEETSTVHSKSKLLGFSFTSAPANDGCQMLAIKGLKDGLITSKELELIGIKEEDIKPEETKEEEKPEDITKNKPKAKKEEEIEIEEPEEVSEVQDKEAEKPEEEQENVDSETKKKEGEEETPDGDPKEEEGETEEGEDGEDGESESEEDKEDEDDKKKALISECQNILDTIKTKKIMYINDRKSVQKEVDDEVSRQLGQLKGKLWIE